MMPATKIGSEHSQLVPARAEALQPSARSKITPDTSTHDVVREFKQAGSANSAVSVAYPIKEEPTSLDQLYRFAVGGYLFALLDSTDQILVPHKAKTLGPNKATSLFSGTAKEQYWAVAPYLFHVDSELLDWIIAKLWREPWGIFALSKGNFEDLRLHFKKFLIVQFPDGKQWFFRYYDPRILRSYLRTCSEEELVAFFGPLRGFGATEASDQHISVTTMVLKHRDKSRRWSPSITQPWKIRAEQSKKLDEQAYEAFIARLAGHLIKHHGNAVVRLTKGVSPLAELLFQHLLQLMRNGLMRARRYGITWECSLTAFVGLMFEIAPNFDEQAAIRKVLTNEHIDPETRVRLLPNLVSGKDWEDAKRAYDPRAWERFR